MQPELPYVELEAAADEIGGLWQQLAGRRVMVTGGTGFIGKWLVGTFLVANRKFELDARIDIITRSSARLSDFRDESLSFVTGDVRSFQSSQAPDFIIHAATPVHNSTEDGIELLDLLGSGTANTLRHAEKPGFQRSLLLSSGAVYGPQPAGLAGFPETWRGEIDWLAHGAAYAQGKRQTEAMSLLHARRHGYPLRCARGFAFTGPGQPLDPRFAISSLFADALHGRSAQLRCGGLRRSYLYAADLAVWLWTYLLLPHAPEFLNVGSDQAVTLDQLAVLVAEICGAPPPAAAEDMRQGSDYIPDISTARALGLRVSTPLDQSIFKTWSHHGRR